MMATSARSLRVVTASAQRAPEQAPRAAHKAPAPVALAAAAAVVFSASFAPEAMAAASGGGVYTKGVAPAFGAAPVSVPTERKVKNLASAHSTINHHCCCLMKAVLFLPKSTFPNADGIPLPAIGLPSFSFSAPSFSAPSFDSPSAPNARTPLSTLFPPTAFPAPRRHLHYLRGSGVFLRGRFAGRAEPGSCCARNRDRLRSAGRVPGGLHSLKPALASLLGLHLLLRGDRTTRRRRVPTRTYDATTMRRQFVHPR